MMTTLVLRIESTAESVDEPSLRCILDSYVRSACELRVLVTRTSMMAPQSCEPVEPTPEESVRSANLRAIARIHSRLLSLMMESEDLILTALGASP
jgi:hypothetical protein